MEEQLKNEQIKAYKGFDKDLKCRGFQYEIGKTYEEKEAKLCESGFHACEKPLDVFKYYKPGSSRFCEVVMDDVSDQRSDDSKRVSKIITIGAEIGIPGLVKAHIEYTKAKAEKDSAATSGDWSSAATSGYRSSAATSGNGSSAATSGEESSAATSNQNGIAVACGKNSKAKGTVGSYIVLTEWNDDSTELLTAKLARVDGNAIKSDTWYTLKNGEFVEVKE